MLGWWWWQCSCLGWELALVSSISLYQEILIDEGEAPLAMGCKLRNINDQFRFNWVHPAHNRQHNLNFK